MRERARRASATPVDCRGRIPGRRAGGGAVATEPGGTGLAGRSPARSGCDRLCRRARARAGARGSIHDPDAAGLGGGTAYVVSPDGRIVHARRPRRCHRQAADLDPIDRRLGWPLNGTEGVNRPFWSPDSQYLAFIAGGKLKKIPAMGGLVQTICDAPTEPTGPEPRRRHPLRRRPQRSNLSRRRRRRQSGGPQRPREERSIRRLAAVPA